MTFRRLVNRSIAVCLAVGLMPGLVATAAAGPLVVEQHDLECGETFPCPPQIQRRVDFWIQVFRTWGTDQMVFHDRRNPSRVYSVITSKHSCHRSRAARAVEAERDRIEKLLRTLAKKVTWKEPGWTREELDYLALFPDRDKDEIERAAASVRCQTGNRDRFREALKRYGRYRNEILRVLREHGLSEDIQYLPFVESAYNPQAYSRAGAASLWQIMPATARKLGLQLDATMDERFDPRRATWAAARYLRRSTDVLTEVARGLDAAAGPAQINPFVITSYNYGVSGMARAMGSVGPDYIEVLDTYRSRSFRTAVRNFYASFLAARYVARHAERYFGPLQSDSVIGITPVALKQPTSVDRIQEVFGVGRDRLEALNPALTRFVWKGWRLIPEGYTLNLPKRTDDWRSQVARLESLPPEDPQLSGRSYVVQRGDTACQVATAFAVQCKDLIQLNGLGRRALIRVGQRLDIPGRPKPTTSQRVASAEGGYYTVRRGDTACEIARSFDIDCRELIRRNRLGSRALIHIGQKLRIPGMRKPPAPEDGLYTVHPGDTACGVAQAFQVNCRELVRANDLGNQALIRVGDRLRIPGAGKLTQAARDENETEAGPDAGAEGSVGVAPIPELMAEVDVAVHAVQVDGETRYATTVLPGEALGHYADWLGLGGTGMLRSINGMSRDEGLRAGVSINLPIDDNDTRLAFEASRFEFHQTLVDEFNQHYRVTGIENHTVKSGDTLWNIARSHDIPYWFLRRANADVLTARLGQTIRIPMVAARHESKQPLVGDN